MFTKLKSIDAQFRQVRTFSIAFLACSTLICCVVIWRSHETLRSYRSKVYVMVQGQLVEAVMRNRDIPLEIRDHVTRFHELFFTLSPDDKAVASQVNKALYLADGSARRMHQNLTEEGYYNRLIAGNISQTVVIDSVVLEMAAAPVRFRCYATQTITRATSVVTRSLVTAGVVRTGITPSPHNTHGFLIERWEILRNEDIQTTER